MALKTIISTDDFEVWLKAYNSIGAALNEQFTITLDGSDDYDSLAIQDIFRDLMEVSLEINKAGIFADPATDHSYVGQFWDENATFDGSVANDNLVYKHTDGKYYQAQSDSLATSEVVGIADVTNGKVIASGFVDTAGAIAANVKVYLSVATAGLITATASDVIIGISLGSGLILLKPNMKKNPSQVTTTLTNDQDTVNNVKFLQGNTLIWLNGLKLVRVVDYVDTTPGTIVLDASIDTDAGDILDIQII